MRPADLRLLERTGALFAQLFFIAAGVYLGNRADDWRQEKSHREAARAALQNFRAEMVTNRDAVRRHAAIHGRYADSMRTSQGRGDPAPRSVYEAQRRLGWAGTAPTTFSHAAWDLGLATQSLSFLPPRLTFDIGDVYTTREHVASIQRDAGPTLFAPSSLADAQILGWLGAFGGYIGDMSYAEPALLGKYDRIIPRLDSALATLAR